MWGNKNEITLRHTSYSIVSNSSLSLVRVINISGNIFIFIIIVIVIIVIVGLLGNFY